MDPQVLAFLNNMTPQQRNELLAKQGIDPSTWVDPPAQPITPAPTGAAPVPTLPGAGTTWQGLTQPPLGPEAPFFDDPAYGPSTPAYAGQLPDAQPYPSGPPRGPLGLPDTYVGQERLPPVVPDSYVGQERIPRPVIVAPKPRPAKVTRSTSGPPTIGRPPKRPAPAKGFKERLKEAWKTRGKDMQELAKERMLKASRR
jgi:hypothetical protein